MVSKLKETLNVHILWHEKFEEGIKFAERLYSQLTSSYEDDVIYRKPDIPVFFYNDVQKIKVDKAKFTAIILLIDDELIIDPIWKSYISELQKEVNDTFRIFPISISSNAFRMREIKQTNFIKLHEMESEEEKIKTLIRQTTHELCRLLLQKPRISNSDVLSTSPVSLFLSHAKKDGNRLTKEIKDYILNETPLKTFFDANDIAAGYSFSNEIEESIEKQETAMLVIHTDDYSSREWCRKEVISAKLSKIPIVVVDVISKGEARRFPYMGNAPTIRWDGSKEEIPNIIAVALGEILRDLYTKLHFQDLLEIYKVSETVNTISTQPELMNFINLIKEAEVNQSDLVLYPDPPIGYEELNLLTELQPEFKFITPTMLPAYRYSGESYEQKLFENMKIGVSVSESNGLRDYGMSDAHFRDAFIEIARYLIIHGATLLYGGDLRKEGYTELLYSLVRSYYPEDVKSNNKIKNYQAWPIHLNVTSKIRADLNDVVDLISVEAPDDLSIDKNKFIKPTNAENRVIWAKSLTKMREQMNRDLDVRILLGGKTEGFIGKYPGLLEEAYLALRDNKPLFVIGAFGGCAKAIIEVLNGSSPEEFSIKYQSGSDNYSRMYTLYNDTEEPEINYGKVISYLNSKGMEGLNNGLSEDENSILFNSTNMPRVISLLLKGLKIINDRNKGEMECE